MAAVKNLFSPEFRNRLDAIIQFKHLDQETIVRVVDKFIMELEAQLDIKGVILNVAPQARMWLAEHGYERSMGARPMARLIQEVIKKPIAEELLFGDLSNGGTLDITVEEGKLAFKIKSLSE